MYQNFLTDIKLHHDLYEYDQKIALNVREQGCCCGGVLHTSNYKRNPKGVPEGVDERFCIRISYCCNREGCRKRTTPPSLRFLGRKVYTAISIIIVFTLGITVFDQIEEFMICTHVILVNETVGRWRQWWNQLPDSTVWRRQGLGTTIDQHHLPITLLETFNGSNQEKLMHLLRFLSPLSTVTFSGGK